MTSKAILLSNEERIELERIVKRDENWRKRCRAQTILHLSLGLPTKEVVVLQSLNKDTVNDRRRYWLESGFDSLVDKPRVGAPQKLGDVERAYLKELVMSEALSSRELVSRLESKFGVIVKVKTLQAILKRLGFVWKRTRHSLKKTESD